MPQQGRILASAARLAKPEERLGYATCSTLAEENDALVEGFLAANPGFRAVPVMAAQAAGPMHPECLALRPARHGTVAILWAVMEREGAASLQK